MSNFFPDEEQPAAPVAAPAPVKSFFPDEGEGAGYNVDIPDIAKSAAIGLPKGVIKGLGAPSDFSEYGARGLDIATRFVGEKLGYDIPERPNQKPRFGAQDIQSGVEGVTGEFYKPKTNYGKIAEGVTESIADPLSYIGPGGPLAKMAIAGAAGAGAESAAQLAEASDLKEYEPVARIVGAVAAGKVPAMAATGKIRSAMKNATSSDQLFASADGLYEVSRTSGVALRPQEFAGLGQRIADDLLKDGFRPKLQGGVFDELLEEMPNAVNKLGVTGITEVQTTRKALAKMAKSPDPSTREAARYAMAEINQYMGHVPPSAIAMGNPTQVKQAVTAWQEADKAYSAGMRMEQLQDALQHAVNRAGTTGKGGNIDNTMRQEIGKIINSPTKRRGFTEAEIERLTKIANGDIKGNLARAMGSMAPTGIVSASLGLHLAEALLGGKHAWFGPTIGYAAKKIGDFNTRSQIEDAITGIGARASGAPMPKHSPPSVLAPGYLAPQLQRIQEEEE